MILGAEIGMLIFGIIALCSGKLTLTKNRVVYGTAARLLGLLAMMPLPLSFGVGLAFGAILASRGQQVTMQSWRWQFVLIEVGILVVCLVAVYGIGFAVAQAPKAKPTRRRRDERVEDEDEDDWEEPERTTAAPAKSARPVAPPTPRAISPGTQLRFPCSGCGTTIGAAAANVGRRVRCPKCQMVQTVADPEATAEPVDPTAVQADRPRAANRAQGPQRPPRPL